MQTASEKIHEYFDATGEFRNVEEYNDLEDLRYIHPMQCRSCYLISLHKSTELYGGKWYISECCKKWRRNMNTYDGYYNIYTTHSVTQQGLWAGDAKVDEPIGLVHICKGSEKVAMCGMHQNALKLKIQRGYPKAVDVKVKRVRKAPRNSDVCQVCAKMFKDAEYPKS